MSAPRLETPPLFNRTEEDPDLAFVKEYHTEIISTVTGIATLILAPMLTSSGVITGILYNFYTRRELTIPKNESLVSTFHESLSITAMLISIIRFTSIATYGQFLFSTVPFAAGCSMGNTLFRCYKKYVDLV